MKNKIKLHLFGDSICFGQFISPFHTWGGMLSNALFRETGDNIWINHFAVSGDTTRLALERMPKHITAYDVDILFYQFGINDSTFWQTERGVPRVSKESFAGDILEISTRAKHAGAKKIIVCTNHETNKMVNLDEQHFPHWPMCAQYNQIIRNIAQNEPNLLLIDMEKKLNKEEFPDFDYLLDDGIHLSQLGHQIYFNNISPVIIQTIRELTEQIKSDYEK